MTALNFPSNPTLSQTHTANGRTWVWDGSAWMTLPSVYDADWAAIAGLTGTSGFLKKTGINQWALDTSTYLTGNQSITVSGDATGSGATSISLTLANSGVTAGTYGNATSIPQFSVDAKGRITSVTNVAVSIPSGSLTFTGDVTGTGNTGASTALTLANSGVTAGAYIKVTVDAKGRVTAGTSLASADVTNALGYTPYNSTNPSGYITGINSSMVTTALGYTPYNAGGNTVLNSSNYTSYSPSLTGSGASGTWGINITGNATTLGGYAPNQTGGAYAIVQRDSNGYIQNSYFYTSGGGSERGGSGLGYFAGFNSSDYYIRSYTPAAAASAMGALTTSNYSSYALPLSGGTLTGALSVLQGSATAVQLSSGYYIGMGSWGLRNTTPYGYIEFGPANSSFAHIYSSLPFYFNQSTLYANGSVMVTAANISSYAPAALAGARAWVNFDGTGTVSTNQTINASYNVSSVYKNAGADWTINYTNAIGNNHALVVTSRIGGGANGAGSGGAIPQIYGANGNASPLLTTSARFFCYNTLTGASAGDIICAVAFSG